MKLLSRTIALLLNGAVAVSLSAQDITVTPPAWVFPESAPDEMPKTKSQLRPDYPVEMRGSDELGYAIVQRFVSTDSERGFHITSATHPTFQRATEDAMASWFFGAAKRHGSPVESQIWVGVIFNPKSSSAIIPDARPRLLDVTPVFASEAPEPSLVVATRINVDATGAVTAASPQDQVSAGLAEAISTAVKSWRFAPARANHRPISAEIVIPVLCMKPISASRVTIVVPKLIKRVSPEYPYAMELFGLRGEVTVALDVALDGTVKNAHVSSSTNPAFEYAALVALRQWRFTPATQDGKPVIYRTEITIRFVPPNMNHDVFQIRGMADQTTLPPELRYDTPPKLRNMLVPVYPYELQRDHVFGKAKIVMRIDPTGHISEVKVVSADRPQFGLALTAAAEGYVFEPALKDGKPVPHLLAFEQAFNFETFRDGSAGILMRLEKRHPEKILSADRLDAPLQPVSRRAALFPVTVPPSATQGEAVIECLVDEEGQVKLPRSVRTSDPAFAYAAMQAANTWWFEPPKSNGKAVVCRVRIRFKFDRSGENDAALLTTNPE